MADLRSIAGSSSVQLAGIDAVADRIEGAYPVRHVGLATLCARGKPVRSAMSVSHPQDLALVQAALAGDLRARARLADRLGCVGRMVGGRHRELGAPLDEATLNDVIGDTIARVWQKSAEYRGLAALESWAFLFCEGELRNAIRRWRRRRERETSMDDAAAAAIQACAVPPPEEDVHLCLQKLVEIDQSVMRWKHFDGFTLEQIAVRLSKNLNTVKSRYTRALRQLKQCLLRRAGEDS